MAQAVQPVGRTGLVARRHPCTGEVYKDKVKLTFARGAVIDDPAGLFNASLTGGARRAIDIRAGEEIDANAFKALVREAVAANVAKRS